MLLGKELKLAKKHVKRLSGGAVSGIMCFDILEFVVSHSKK